MNHELGGALAVDLFLAAFLWFLCVWLIGPWWALVPALGIAGAHYAWSAAEIWRAWR